MSADRGAGVPVSDEAVEAAAAHSYTSAVNSREMTVECMCGEWLYVGPFDDPGSGYPNDEREREARARHLLEVAAPFMVRDAVTVAVAAERERIAVAIEALRVRNPMNGDGSNYMLDRVINKIDQLAGDGRPSTAAAFEKARRDDEYDRDYCKRYDMPPPTTSHVERLTARIARESGDQP